MNKLLHFTARPMSRDKGDTLLLLLACALILLPQASHVPPWVMAASTTLLLWRGWVTFRGNRMPSRWLLLPVAVLAMAAVYANYKTLFGHEAGVAMLMLLLALKLLEMHAKRDLFVALFLGYFLLLTNFFNSQTMGAALMAMVAVVAMLVAQLSFQYTGAVPPLKKRLGLVLLIIGLALPLMVVQFVFFPRIQGPLWNMPGDANTSRSGLSDTMAPGNIARLALSDDVAFRVRFIDAAPPKANLYWRGVVLGNYDGRTWTRRPSASDGPMLLHTRGRAIRHEVTLEPHAKRWLFALELPQSVPTLKGDAAHTETDGQLLSGQTVDERLRYTVASFIDFDLLSDPPSSANRGWNALPAGLNPQTLAFALQLRRQWRDDAQLINAVLRHFREEKFSYTLEPPLLGRHAVDEFLFSTRAGFCEHYASAFVVLMRAARIPARVVTGYQGGEINPVDGFMTVRQSDAHAWAEVWLQGRGWVRVDPTAAVAPNRVQLNLSQTLPAPALGGLINLNAIGRNSWLASLRFRRDAVNNAWNQWVLNYSPTRQRSLIQSLGFDNVDWYTMGGLLLGAGALVLAVIAWPLTRNRQKSDPVRALYGRFCQLMAKYGLAHEQHEGPRDYRNRIIHVGTALAHDKKIAASRFLEYYEAVQYGTVSAAPNPAALSQLKSLLVQCR